MNKYRLSALAAIVIVCTIIGSIIVAIVIATGGITSTSTPILVSLIAILTPTVPALLALVKVEQNGNDIRNGLIEDKVKKAITDLDEERDNNG